MYELTHQPTSLTTIEMLGVKSSPAPAGHHAAFLSVHSYAEHLSAFAEAF